MTTTKTAAASTESWLLTHRGVDTIRHEPALPLSAIDLVASMTNQSRFNPIDETTVDRYVAALADGALFPSIICRDVDGQLIILGGNHRVRAHLDAKRKTIDAHVIVCDDITALEVAYGDNATHGLPPTDAERVAHALVLVDHGRTAADAARTVGIDPQRVTKRLAAAGVDRRAARLNVAAELTRVPDTIRPRLASLAHDKVFTTVIKAFASEQVDTKTGLAIIGDLNAQPTPQAALELLKVHIAEHRAYSSAGRGVGRPSTNPYLQLRTALGTVRHTNAADVVDHVRSGRELDELARLCMDGARHLKAIHDLAKVRQNGAA